MQQQWLNKLCQMASLTYNWDGDGASQPTDVAISNARLLALQIEGSFLLIEDIEPDVIGGVVVLISSSNISLNSNRSAWFECRNSGHIFLVLDYGSDSGKVTVIPVENVVLAIAEAALFLSRINLEDSL